jgi:hypothetical protein
MEGWDITSVGLVHIGTSITGGTISGGIHPKVRSARELFLLLTAALLVPFHSARLEFSKPKNAPLWKKAVTCGIRL